jgi:4-oxalocrotonate tautomerase family enzyme
VPLVEVSWFTGRTEDQKGEVVRLITDAMCKVLPISRDQVSVIFREVEPGDWWEGDVQIGPKPKAHSGEHD